MNTPLKDLYTKELIENLAVKIQKEYTRLNTPAFINDIFNHEWQTLELKGRIRHISSKLHKHIPQEYEDQLTILMRVAPLFKNDFLFLFFPDFVEQYGIDHPETSFKALELFTQHSSSEFAIRPFIVKYPEMSLKQLKIWSKHKNEHLRRLSSEGCRPRLPWAQALPNFKKDPSPILPILYELKQDSSAYVRKSVANNLNDISKDHPELLLKIAKEWLGNHKDTDWIIKHACRTLLKQGHRDALALFGQENAKGISIEQLKLSSDLLKIGEELIFTFNLTNSNNKTKNLRIEFAILYTKKNHKPSEKKFKLSEKTYQGNSCQQFSKNISFKDLSTRKHYPGKHSLSIVVNGNKLAEKEFYLN